MKKTPLLVPVVLLALVSVAVSGWAQVDTYITDGPGAAGVITSTVLPGCQIQFATKLQF